MRRHLAFYKVAKQRDNAPLKANISLSGHPNCQSEVVAYQNLDYIRSNFSSLEISRHLTLQTDGVQCTPVCAFFWNILFLRKFYFEKNSGPTRECNNVITLIIQFSLRYLEVVPYGRIKTRKFLTFDSKRWSCSLKRGCHLQEVPNILIWGGKPCCFGKRVAYGGGRNRKFRCTKLSMHKI